MEVHIRDVPADLTARTFQRHLEPLLKNLDIVNFLCEKARNKTYANVTFVHENDGHRFLSFYGPRGRPLSMLGQTVRCQLSKKRPDENTLKVIEYEMGQRQKRSSKPSTQAQPKSKPLQATGLSCGFHKYIDGRFSFVSEWDAREACLVKFSKRHLIFKLTDRGIHVRIPRNAIVQLVWSGSGRASVTLSHPPIILATKQSNGASEAIVDDLESIFAKPLFRQQPKSEPQKRLSAIDDSHGAISAFCLVYHFEVTITSIGRYGGDGDFHKLMWNITESEPYHVTRAEFDYYHASSFPRLGRFSEALTRLERQLASYTTSNDLPFGILFLLQALVYNCYLHPATVQGLAKELVARSSISIDAVKKLFDWVDYPAPESDPRQFEVDGIIEQLNAAEQQIQDAQLMRAELFNDNQSSARIFRVSVSPMRITLHGPELETKNRILRMFDGKTDFFFRVQLCDENGQDLFPNATISLSAVYDRFKSVLRKGISVAGRHYSFLGFSHSSLRAHSLWFSAPFEHGGTLHIPGRIIEQLGDFAPIRSPARCAARIGQKFTETPYSVSLKAYGIQINEVPDVERNNRVFSDGVGMISLEAAEAIHEIIPESKGKPTCFQIRWAGAKGMLSLGTELEGNQICIRPSMKKFESSDEENLDICDMASKPIPMMLNRQLIKIMEDMGAPAWWFLELQQKEVNRLRAITRTVSNTASFLAMKGIGESIHLSQFLRQAEAMDADYRQDLFLRNVVEMVLLKEMKLLKHKARIPVPRGITLFGVMDETGLLEEGQVCVSFDTMQGRYREPPGCRQVIVTRSPALHPGDIQMVQNVIPPEGHPLSELRNCVVFSQKGSRDLPSMLSGGDLDGDIYNIIWDDAIVSQVRTFQPADYPRLPIVELDRKVEPADMTDFFVDFISQDCLGVIATRHMILADLRLNGTLDPDCVKMAELHSLAVDFSKTGRAVNLRELPKTKKERRPHFLAAGSQVVIHDREDVELVDEENNDDGDDDEDGEDGPRHQYYFSEKILGKLYSAINEEQVWHQDIQLPRKSLRYNAFWIEMLAALEQRVTAVADVNWLNRVDEAHRIRHTYEDAVYSIMVDYSDHPFKPLRETEMFSGFIINKTGGASRRQRDKSIKMNDEFERISKLVMNTMHKGHDALELCLACVHAGVDKELQGKKAWHRGSPDDVVSFRIVAASALLRELNALESRDLSL
ncbi:RNA dependent RNA polymerase-domain-containing protein [Apiosordaria backusii]|uniref:RNA-dependent RNA polymerase n=1 Tax=Apiosordaria backusii TaxID=314023 RepID=A0AA40BL17_9PEZI|nr:RNA dependent RNA polymerase-domain-containing protein [Apiosordaria backusii]